MPITPAIEFHRERKEKKERKRERKWRKRTPLQQLLQISRTNGELDLFEEQCNGVARIPGNSPHSLNLYPSIMKTLYLFTWPLISIPIIFPCRLWFTIPGLYCVSRWNAASSSCIMQLQDQRAFGTRHPCTCLRPYTRASRLNLYLLVKSYALKRGKKWHCCVNLRVSILETLATSLWQWMILPFWGEDLYVFEVTDHFLSVRKIWIRFFLSLKLQRILCYRSPLRYVS